jgi:hypothetical protein
VLSWNNGKKLDASATVMLSEVEVSAEEFEIAETHEI